MNFYEQHLRELAHQIWESEGKPEGQAQRHWKLAELMAAAEESQVEVATKIKPLDPIEMIEPEQ